MIGINLRDKRIGLEKLNNQGCLMKIIEYNDYSNIIVEFQDEYKAHINANMERFMNGKIRNPNYRLGQTRINNQGCLMKVIKYKSTTDMEVEFQDEYKTVVKTEWRNFDNGSTKNPKYRFGIEKYNNKKYLMKCVEYINYSNILVEFQDEYHAKVHTSWENFENGTVRNPYEPSVFNVGIIGNKYSSIINKKITKEYNTWHAMLSRCYDEKTKEKNPTYKDVTCCDEWLLYENFYEWLHSQENFDKWYNNNKWALDKDILIKGNKIYSPNTCCLVPIYINSLFTKNNAVRGNLPIGVSKNEKRHGYSAMTIYGRENNKTKTTGYCYPTPEDAFYLGYKPSKENCIKQVAQEEYNKGNITKKCYEAMMKYEVEITD